jgi:hypothetical protein
VTTTRKASRSADAGSARFSPTTTSMNRIPRADATGEKRASTASIQASLASASCCGGTATIGPMT